MSTEDRPSKRQRELLNFINGFIVGHGYGPSYREIMRALNYKSVSTVATHVDNLVAKGKLAKRDHSARSLEVVDSESTFRASTHVTKSQEKWLVDNVKKRFEEAEKFPPTQKQIDDLYVLVGSLQVLGFEDPARAYKERLTKLQTVSSKEIKS